MPKLLQTYLVKTTGLLMLARERRRRKVLRFIPIYYFANKFALQFIYFCFSFVSVTHHWGDMH